MKPAYYIYIWSAIMSVVTFLVSILAFCLGSLPVGTAMMVLWGVFATIWGCLGASSKGDYNRRFVK
jgi:hypothetical protein